ncbi:MAG: outer membrane beta-barrel protein [Xanthobacteraceae bacterium]
MKKILLATVAAIGFAGTASAADLAVRPAPVYAPVFNWSGCYIGGYVGGAWTAENAKVYDVNGYNLFPADYWSYDNDSSFIGGGTVGCNWQPVGSPFVFGIEGEVGYVNLEGTGYDPFAGVAPANTIYSTTKIGDWYGMITGRLGYAWDRVLVYVKGGAAFLTVDTAVYDPGFIAAAGSEDVSTWTVGGGLEYAFDWNWSLKAEYMFIGLDNYNACGFGVGGFGAGTYCWNHDIEGIHTAKIGLNYRFGGGAPLVARY